MFRKVLQLTIAALLIPLGMHAQKHMYGIISDATGKPLPFASIYIEDMQKGIVADNEGRYMVPVMPAGKHKVKVSFIGYNSFDEEVTMNGTPIERNYKLKETTIDLDNLFVLPNGMDFCTFVLKKMQQNVKPLKKRVASYDCTTTGILKKDIDLSTLKKRRTIRFGLLLMSWGKIFDIMMKYPQLSITMSENLHFQNGSMKNSKLRIVNTTPKLTDRELESIGKKDWFLDRCAYDEIYDLVMKDIKELKKHKNGKQLKYTGSYQEGKYTILTMEYKRTHVEIVDGLWQIRRARYHKSDRTIYFEFNQVAPGIFLPTSGYAHYDVDYEGYPKGKVNLSMGLSYRNIKKR